MTLMKWKMGGLPSITQKWGSGVSTSASEARETECCEAHRLCDHRCITGIFEALIDDERIREQTQTRERQNLMQQDDGGGRKQRADASGPAVPNSELRVIRRPLSHMNGITVHRLLYI